MFIGKKQTAKRLSLRLTLGALGVGGALLVGSSALALPAFAASSFYYTFNAPGTLYEAAAPAQSSSPYFWLKSGAKLVIANGHGSTISGTLPATDPWHTAYASGATVTSDGGTHPQNAFLLLTKQTMQDGSAQVYIDRTRDNLANSANRVPYIGDSVIARYQDQNNYYYAGVRADGYVVIKKKVNGVYTTLATKKLFAGTYNASTNPDLLPLNKWIGLKLAVATNSNGAPQLTLSTDIGWSGNWQQQLSVADNNGTALTAPGMVGIENDYADATFDNFVINGLGSNSVTLVSAPTSAPTPTPSASSSYDSTVLSGSPAMYLTMSSPSSGKETDKSGHSITGTYKGGTPGTATLPNGDTAADFNGTSEYLNVPSTPSLSIPATGKLTVEAWIRPDTFQFPVVSGDGYVDWMGKCQNYSPNCEWESRIYADSTTQGRGDRVSAYVFNPSAGLGSAADWQPSSGVLSAGQWIHVVAEYDTTSTPSGCNSAYPGSINIWVNGVKQDAAAHFPTGCMSQYSIRPTAGSSPLDIGTMAFDTWFKGAIGKVAVYDRLLSQSEINSHYTAMTSNQPAGSCGQTCSL